jgi:translation initiation factor 2B subunit (eIF-2B alpha/beta/delta family)
MVGAHSLHSNGAVFSRAGTALVAMLASQHSIPVIVCCETYKFAEGVQLDSFTKNELGAYPAHIAWRKPLILGSCSALGQLRLHVPSDATR